MPALIEICQGLISAAGVTAVVFIVVGILVLVSGCFAGLSGDFTGEGDDERS